MIRSTIDIGTNTILLLIAEYKNGSVYPIVDIQRVPRLGKGVDANRNIMPESIAKAVQPALPPLLQASSEIQPTKPNSSIRSAVKPE